MTGTAETTIGEPEAAPVDGAELAPVDRRVLVVAGITAVALLACSSRYGFDRDELYFLDCGRHLAASYVDQPFFTPLLARISLDLFGVSLVGLRLWADLAAGGTVLLGGLLARELGGGRVAQLLTALGVATAPVVLGADHLFGPTAFDLLAWAGLALVVVRIGRTGRARLWVPAGVVTGIGLANKHSIAFFALALVLGIVVSGGGHILCNRWFVLGVAVALACTVPDLVWQSSHDWATLSMTRALARENGGTGNIAPFVFAQLFLVTPFLIWLWTAGLRWLWRSAVPAWRAFAWAYGLLFVFFALTAGAKPYYVGGAYAPLVAAGAVWAERRWAARGQHRIGAGVLCGIAVSTLVSLSIVLPVLPAADIGWVHGLNATPAETVGWPELVHTVARVWDGLPAGERAHAVIFTADYGEAGAITELGRPLGLPVAVSSQNNEWWWGPGDPRASTVVAVAPGPMDVTGYGAYLHTLFGHVRTVATLGNASGVDNQEAGGHVYICTDPHRPWGEEWASVRQYS